MSLLICCDWHFVSVLDELFFEPKEGWSDDDESVGEMFATQSYHAQQKLQQLDTKITNKSQALQALKTSRKADPKVQYRIFQTILCCLRFLFYTQAFLCSMSLPNGALIVAFPGPTLNQTKVPTIVLT